jgi:hypothetical protein
MKSLILTTVIVSERIRLDVVTRSSTGGASGMASVRPAVPTRAAV